MQTGGITGSMHNPVQMNTLNGNDPSKSALNLLRKQKAQLQEQIKTIKGSKLSDEIKEEKIKALQEQIAEIEKQIIEEQSKKPVESIEAKNGEYETEREDDENLQVVNKKVMTGIISASQHLETGDVALSVYRKAKAEGDMSKMKRALSYAVPEFKKASQSKRLIERGIQEYKNQTGEADKTEPTAENVKDADIQGNDIDKETL